MTGRQRPTRARNPAARAEFVDPLTGQRVPAGTPAAVPSGRKIVRVRPRKGEAFETVTVDGDDLDPRRDTFGVDPSSTGRYQQIAAHEAAARSRTKPLERDADLNLGKIGASTTFPSGKRAAEIFVEQNAHLFDDPSFEDVDAYDATLDFMDGIEVRSGNRRVRLSKTARGEQILRAGAHSGSAIAKDMLAYLFGQAGTRRRWRDVPWSAIDGYVAVIRQAMSAEASRRGGSMPSSAAFWYPLASGVYDADTMLSLAVDELGEAKAEKLADWLNSQAMYDLAERLEHVLHPRKGVPGRGGRRARKCLGKEDRKTVAARRRQILQWAAYPETVPQWACVSTQATETSAAGICIFPGLEEEVRRVEAACDVPYDPAWPAKERARRCSQGQIEEIDQFGSGVAPLGCDDVGPNAIEPLPWENNPNSEKPIATRKTAQGSIVHLYADGSLTWALGRYIKGSPQPRTPEQIEKALRAGWMVIHEVEIYDDDDVSDLIAAARWAADRGLQPGDMRERMHARQPMKPVWTVKETDRDGRPTLRVWKLPRMGWPGLAIFDDKGKYSAWHEIGRSGTYEPSGITFKNLRDVTKYLDETRARGPGSAAPTRKPNPSRREASLSRRIRM